MTTTEAQALEASRAPGSAVRALFMLVALTAALWLVNVFGRTLPSAALVLAWAAATAGIGVALFRRARVRRAAFLKAYVRGGSPLERRLRGGWLMAAGSTLVAALLALFLLAAVLRLEDRSAWLALLSEDGGELKVPIANADEVARPDPGSWRGEGASHRHPRDVRVVPRNLETILPKSRDFH